MKIVKVTYTVKPAFVPKNQENINAFINDIRKLENSGIRYSVYLGEDGKTFTHLAIYNSDEAQSVLLELGSFKSFQLQRDQSGLEVAPKIEMLNAVASSYNIF